MKSIMNLFSILIGALITLFIFVFFIITPPNNDTLHMFKGHWISGKVYYLHISNLENTQWIEYQTN